MGASLADELRKSLAADTPKERQSDYQVDTGIGMNDSEYKIDEDIPYTPFVKKVRPVALKKHAKYPFSAMLPPNGKHMSSFFAKFPDDIQNSDLDEKGKLDKLRNRLQMAVTWYRNHVDGCKEKMFKIRKVTENGVPGCRVWRVK